MQQRLLSTNGMPQSNHGMPQSNAPAIQAVLTVVAVAIAIYVPFQIHSNETHRRECEIRRKGQAIALLIGPLLRVVDEQIERANFVPLEGPRQIEIPETVLSLLKDLWLMGAAGELVLQLIGILQAHNRILERTISLPVDMLEEEKREFSQLFHERLNLARGCLRDTFAAIDILLERKA